MQNSKKETGKPNNPAHDNVDEWKCFVTNLVYQDSDGAYTDCYMNIDVKQKEGIFLFIWN